MSENKKNNKKTIGFRGLFPVGEKAGPSRSKQKGMAFAHLPLLAMILFLGLSFILSGCGILEGGALVGRAPMRSQNLFRSAASGCCRRALPSQNQQNTDRELAAEEFVRKTYDIEDFKIVTVDYGCHVQYDVYAQDDLFRSLVYRQGDFIELSRSRV